MEHIDLTHFDDFYTTIEYKLINDITKGLNYSFLDDAQRYSSRNLSIYVHRGVRNDVQDYLKKNFNWLKNHSFAINLMEPGMILPTHKDRYEYYSRLHNIKNINKICRIIIFLEDWKKGHISQIGETITSPWKAGNWVHWTGDTEHLAANLGNENRYILQLTGELD